MERKPRLLDLFCGAGGAGTGYSRAGFEVVGVDIEPQPNYPFAFAQCDALEVLRTMSPAGFDAIHASPPCQAYTELNNDKSEHPRLIGPLRELLEATGLPYVIENVVGAKSEMRSPVKLSGSQFDLNVQRARLFETNWELVPPAYGEGEDRRKKFLVYEHGKWRWTTNVPVYGTGGGKASEYWPYAMGVGDTWDDCWMTRAELAEAIPPAYTEYIGLQLSHLLLERAA